MNKHQNSRTREEQWNSLLWRHDLRTAIRETPHQDKQNDISKVQTHREGLPGVVPLYVPVNSVGRVKQSYDSMVVMEMILTY